MYHMYRTTHIDRDRFCSLSPCLLWDVSVREIIRRITRTNQLTASHQVAHGTRVKHLLTDGWQSVTVQLR